MKISQALALSLLGFALATSAAMAEEANDHAAAAHETKAKHMLEGYAAVSTALYKDDLAAAREAASGMVKQEKEGTMAKPAQAIADSKDLEQARTHFKALSDAAILVAKTEKTMHRMHCPMAMNGKGVDWLQKSADEVQNPYMGAQMPHCGKMVK